MLEQDRIILDAFLNDPELVVLQADLAVRWRNRIVALASDGFIYAASIVPKFRHNEFLTRRLPLKDVRHVVIEKRLALFGLLLGPFFLLIAAGLAWAAWRGELAGLELLILLPVLGVALTFGLRRSRVQVVSDHGTYTWRSGPLEYKSSRRVCAIVAVYCRRKGIPLVGLPSHLPRPEELEAATTTVPNRLPEFTARPDALKGSQVPGQIVTEELPARARWSRLGIAAGCFGLLSVLVIPSPAALVLGSLAIRNIRLSRQTVEERGMGLAVFGVVMGAIFSAVLATVACVMMIR